MVLASYGELRTPVEMKVLAASADPQFPGTYFRDMIAGVAKLGYHWHEETYPLTRVGFRRGIKQVRSSLNSGYPVLVGVSHPPIGHTVVVVGYDEKLSRIHLMDPELEEPGTRTLSYEEFEREWRENIIDIRAAIFTKPRR
jgi:hypothetical protein